MSMIEFGKNSLYYSKLIRSKAKMIEFDIPKESHIQISDDAIKTFLVSLAIVTDTSRKYYEAYINRNPIDNNLKIQLHYAAEYFDALVLSELESTYEYKDFIALIGATAYYLGEYNGSSKVMISYISDNIKIENDSLNLAIVLKDIMTGNIFYHHSTIKGKYSEELNHLIQSYKEYIFCNKEISTTVFKKLKNKVYDEGNDFSIIIVNCLLSIICKKINCSSTKLLPIFSGLSFSVWQNYINSEGSIKELWPSQIELGMKGFLLGKSGVVQLPTSSGKTASICLILSSSFYSNRVYNAIIVAPFRSLCREIYRDIHAHFNCEENIIVSEIFDLPEVPHDFSLINDGKKRVFILTPEKLLFLIRNHPSIISKFGLCIFDEAHLFDDSSRGTDYELLLSTLKMILPFEAQKVLISAVVPNGEVINDWFNYDGEVIANNTIKTTEKRVAFSVSNKYSSQIRFVNPLTFEEDFFVPRTVEINELQLLGNERNKRLFPDINSANDLSIYYGSKLVKNGGVAIFCGRKDIVNVILRRFLDLNKRGYNLDAFLNVSDIDEITKIGNLIKKNLGNNSIEYECSKLGVFSHSSGLPIGIRIAVEYAFSKHKISNVVCTSTLAQGVNLPIKYLLVSSFYQAGIEIKVRDFQNLVGRAGRAGKYTEGTIIITEPRIYKYKGNYWKLKKYKQLLNPENSEGCQSNILSIVKFNTIVPSDYSYKEVKYDFWGLIKKRYRNHDEYERIINSILLKINNKHVEYKRDFNTKIREIETTLSSIENYVASMYNEEQEISRLAENTFGYFLGSDIERKKIIEIFIMVVENLEENSLDGELIAKNSIGLFKSKMLKLRIKEKFDIINACESETELLSSLIEIISDFSNNNKIKKLSSENLKFISQLWIDGISYYQIYDSCLTKSINIEKNGKLKPIDLSDIINICDNAFGYEAIILLNAINNIFEDLNETKSDLLTKLIKKLKYGLSLEKEINIYELGFSDRIVSQLIGNEIQGISKNHIRDEIKQKSIIIKDILKDFPSYYTKILNEM